MCAMWFRVSIHFEMPIENKYGYQCEQYEMLVMLIEPPKIEAFHNIWKMKDKNRLP